METPHRPYKDVLKHEHDFEVEYKILTEAEGGRKTLPFQGIRWDLWYDYQGKHQGQLFMIWPEFLDQDGEVIAHRDRPVPIAGKARMWIVNDAMRAYHQDKIEVGLLANAHEGGTVVARYVVTKIVGLMTNPVAEN